MPNWVKDTEMKLRKTKRRNGQRTVSNVTQLLLPDCSCQCRPVDFLFHRVFIQMANGQNHSDLALFATTVKKKKKKKKMLFIPRIIFGAALLLQNFLFVFSFLGWY